MAKKVYSRQRSRHVVVDLGIANMGASNGCTAVLPTGAMLIAVALVVATAFNSATTATATIADGTTTFANGVDVKTAGAATVTGAPKFYPNGGVLTFSLAQTGAAATVGRAIATVSYVIVGAEDEVQE